MAESMEPRPIWLKWAYVYGCLEVEEYDSFDEAVEALEDASGAGTESYDCIEGPGGVVPDDELQAARKRLWQAEEAEKAANPSPRKTHYVTIASPRRPKIGVQDAPLEWFYSEAEAHSAARELDAVFPGRVKVKPAR